MLDSIYTCFNHDIYTEIIIFEEKLKIKKISIPERSFKLIWYKFSKQIKIQYLMKVMACKL